MNNKVTPCFFKCVKQAYFLNTVFHWFNVELRTAFLFFAIFFMWYRSVNLSTVKHDFIGVSGVVTPNSAGVVDTISDYFC